MKRCSQCGKEYSDEATVCVADGQPLAAVAGVSPEGAPPRSPSQGLAVTSLVLGVLSIVCCGLLAGLPAIVMGHIAFGRANRSPQRYGGRGLAIAGFVTGYCSFFTTFILLALFLPALAKAHHRAQSIGCMNNVRELVMDLRIYGTDHDSRMPAAGKGCEAVKAQGAGDRIFRCPVLKLGQRCGYAFNANLSEIDLARVTNPAATVLLFESDGGWDANGGIEAVSQQLRHSKAVVVGFVDGHVEVVTAARLPKLRWDP